MKNYGNLSDGTPFVHKRSGMLALDSSDLVAAVPELISPHVAVHPRELIAPGYHHDGPVVNHGSPYSSDLKSDCEPNRPLKKVIEGLHSARRLMRERRRRLMRQWLSDRKSFAEFTRRILAHTVPRFRKIPVFVVNDNDALGSLNSPAAKRLQERGWTIVPTDGLFSGPRSRAKTLPDRFRLALTLDKGLRRRVAQQCGYTAHRDGSVSLGYHAVPSKYVAIRESSLIAVDPKRTGRLQGRYPRNLLNRALADWEQEHPAPTFGDTGLVDTVERLRREAGNLTQYHSCTHVSSISPIMVKTYVDVPVVAQFSRDQIPPSLAGLRLPENTLSCSVLVRGRDGTQRVEMWPPKGVHSTYGRLLVPDYRRWRDQRFQRPIHIYNGVEYPHCSEVDLSGNLLSDRQIRRDIAHAADAVREDLILTQTAQLRRDDFSLTRSIVELRDMPSSLRTILRCGRDPSRFRHSVGRLSQKLRDRMSPWLSGTPTPASIIAVDLATKWGVVPTISDINTVTREGLQWCAEYYRAVRQLYAHIDQSVRSLTLKKNVRRVDWRSSVLHVEDPLNEPMFIPCHLSDDWFELSTTFRGGPQRVSCGSLDEALDPYPFGSDPTLANMLSGSLPESWYGKLPANNSAGCLSLLATTTNQRFATFARVDARRLRDFMDGHYPILEAFASQRVLKTTWDLIPLSFVVDWFTNIGREVNALESLIMSGVMNVSTSSASAHPWLNHWWHRWVGATDVSQFGASVVLASGAELSWVNNDPDATGIVSMTRTVVGSAHYSFRLAPNGAGAMLYKAAEYYRRAPAFIAGWGDELLNVRLDLGKLTSLAELASSFLK